jgi:hypothetical protein
MIINFNGSFQGDMVANGNLLVKKDQLFIYGVNLDSTNVLFTYDGDFSIKRVYAYIDNINHYIITRKSSDNVNNIKSTWNLSTSKYTDFYRTNKGKPYRQTILRKRK